MRAQIAIALLLAVAAAGCGGKSSGEKTFNVQGQVLDVTPDHQPILGEVEDGVYVAAGFSGHGFMIAPAVARIIADVVLENRRDPALEVLDAGRFAENRLVPEPQLV